MILFLRPLNNKTLPVPNSFLKSVTPISLIFIIIIIIKIIIFYKRNKRCLAFLEDLEKNPNKKLNVLLEEDYKAIEFFKSKGFDINYVTLSFFRVCKSKKQIIKLKQ